MNDPQSWNRLERIGVGSYGSVYKAINRKTNQLAAIKVLNLDTCEEDAADIRKEIALLSQLKEADAQNVTRYYGSVLCGEKLWIIMEYCHGGSIRTLMKSGRFEEKHCAIIIREVLLALDYIHKCGIIHRDVKAANILVTNAGRVQLCDFGVATQLAAKHLKRSTFVGTPYWMAPEVITEGSKYDFSADIWSLGITLYEIATGDPPYADQEPMRAIILIPSSQPTRLEGPGYSGMMKDMLALCIALNPLERPSAEELMKTKFIKAYSKHSVSCLRDLITRFERWRESGGVRKSLLTHARKESFASELNVEETCEEPIRWDFDCVRPHIQPSIAQSFVSTTSESNSGKSIVNGAIDLSFASKPSQDNLSQTSSIINLDSNSNEHATNIFAPSTAMRSEHRLVKLFDEPVSFTASNPSTIPSDGLSSSHLAPVPLNLDIPHITADIGLINNHLSHTNNFQSSAFTASASSSASSAKSACPESSQIKPPCPEPSGQRGVPRTKISAMATPKVIRTEITALNGSHLGAISAPPTGSLAISSNSAYAHYQSDNGMTLSSVPSNVSYSVANSLATPSKTGSAGKESLLRSRIDVAGGIPVAKSASFEPLRLKIPKLKVLQASNVANTPKILPPSPSRQQFFASSPHSETQTPLSNLSDPLGFPLPTTLNLSVLHEVAKPAGSGFVAGKALAEEVNRILLALGSSLDVIHKGLTQLERTESLEEKKFAAVTHLHVDKQF